MGGTWGLVTKCSQGSPVDAYKELHVNLDADLNLNTAQIRVAL